MVAGYQGGEVNPAGNYLSVHQFDAHAWVEYWVAERGWVSVDPTFQVAPERVEQGLEQAWRGSELADEPLLRFRDVGWMNTLRLRWDSLNYGWQRWVLNYQDEQQSQMLQRWFGKLDGQALGLGLVAARAADRNTGARAVQTLAAGKDVQQRQFDRFERLLARQGIRRHKGEGHVASPSGPLPKCPDQAPAIRAFVRLYEAQRYAQLLRAGEPSRALTNVRRAMPWRIAAPRRHS